MKTLLFFLLSVMICDAQYLQHRRAAFRAAAGSWTPSSLSGLAVWYSADDVSGSDGDLVSSLTDKSGNNNTLTNRTSSLSPYLSNNVANGHKALVSTSRTKKLGIAALAGGPINQPYTVALCFQKHQPDYVYYYYVDCGIDSGLLYQLDNDHLMAMYAGTSRTVGDNSLSISEAVQIWTYTFNGASSSVRVNGTDYSILSPGTGAFSQFTLFQKGNAENVGGICEIFEVFVYAGDKSASYTDIQSYLATKYKVTW